MALAATLTRHTGPRYDGLGITGDRRPRRVDQARLRLGRAVRPRAMALSTNGDVIARIKAL